MQRIIKKIKTEKDSLSTKGVDLLILGAVFLLAVFGLIMVYDASVVQAFRDHGDKYFYIKQQFIWVMIGFVSLGIFSYLDYRLLFKVSLVLFILSLILLVAVFIPGLGVAAGGAHRWLKVAGFTIQPGEIIKLASVIFLASLFIKKVKTAPFLIVVSLISLILGVFQRDLGSTAVFFLTALGIYFVAGAPIRYFLLGLPLSCIIFLVFILPSSYRKQRVLAFLDPFYDPQGVTYHISQILIALGSGGWFGLGLGQSRQKFEYIPEVTTDSIFAVIGEEFGFLGAVIFIGVFMFLVFRGFKVAEEVSDEFGRLVAFGITAWLGSQALVNLASMASLIPLTGVPLPFVSYGGSAILTNLVAVGILLNISKSRKKL